MVNVLACFLLGFVQGMVELKGWFSTSWRLFFVVGFLGSFSTYSTFAGETYALMRSLDWALAAFNVAAHIVLGLVSLWLGILVAQLLG